jgi:hypothetical protein
MKLLDFLFFFLTRWFEVVDKRKTKTVSYPDQSVYALSICFTLWLLTINGFIDYFVFKTFKSKIPEYLFVIVALLIYLGLRHLYIAKDRYQMISNDSNRIFKVSEKKGIIISLVFFFSSIVALLVSAVVLHSL